MFSTLYLHKNKIKIIFSVTSNSGSPVSVSDNNEVSRGVLANQTAYNVSKLLDSLLQDYDNSLRPDFAGKLNPILT